MKLKKNDKVEIVSGKDKGKSGKVLQVFPESGKIVVAGLNLLVKSTRPKRQGEKGQQVRFPASLFASKVVLLCPKCGQKTKIGYRLAERGAEDKIKLRGKKFRQCRRCQELID